MMGGNVEKRKHDEMLPNTIRAITCGPSNCCKTNVFISLLKSPNGYVYSKSLQQPKYRNLENLFTSIDEIGYFTFSKNSDVIPPSEAFPNSIFIFDDMRFFVDSLGVRAIKRESRDEDAATAFKRERKEEEEQKEEGEEVSETFECSTTLHKFNDRTIVYSGQQDKESSIDHEYGVYLHKDGLMFGNKRFDVDNADNIIIDGVGRLLSNRAYKYKHVITLLKSITPKKQKKKSRKELPHAMTLNDNAIDYIARRFAPNRQQRSRQRDRQCCRLSRNFAKLLNRIFMKRFSRVTSARKNILFSCTQCIMCRIMKKKSEKKRDKISSERRRLVAELHAPARRNFPRRRVIIQGYDDLWQADVVEMRPYSGFNRGHHYILTVIDMLSKYTWAVPLKSKGGSETANAIARCVNHYSTYSTLKASKNDMWKMFTLNGNYRGMRPVDVTPAIAIRLLDTVYSAIKIAGSAKFKVDDSVRVSKYKTIFEKGLSRKIVAVTFYEHELHRATHPDLYLVEKVLCRKGNKVYIKWLGFDGSHNSWIHKNNVIDKILIDIFYFYI
ncbi:CEC1 protein, partial [Acromyrmex charruanus]